MRVNHTIGFFPEGRYLPPVHLITNVQSVGYWSATTGADGRTLAWDVGFFNAFVTNDNKVFSWTKFR